MVTYVNTSAAVKAESDICCTSANAVEVVESLGSERVIFLPDEFLARHVASQTDVDVIIWKGRCEVHERFTSDDLSGYRQQFSDIQILAHPECPPDRDPTTRRPILKKVKIPKIREIAKSRILKDHNF